MADKVTGGALCAEGELLKRLRRAPLLGVIGELNTSWADGELGNCKTEKTKQWYGEILAPGYSI